MICCVTHNDVVVVVVAALSRTAAGKTTESVTPVEHDDGANPRATVSVNAFLPVYTSIKQAQ